MVRVQAFICRLHIFLTPPTLTRVDSPNFVLHPPTHDAEPPEWPCISCRDGYAWSLPPASGAGRDRRVCSQGHTAARAELVAQVLKGRPIDRVWALRQLLMGAPGDRCPGVLVVLWPSECRGCGRDHTDAAVHWKRAAASVHPGAIEELRAADPALGMLLDIAVPLARRYKLDHPRARAAGLPVAGTSDATERAQILWAIDLAARKAHPLRRKRTKITREPAQEGEGR